MPSAMTLKGLLCFAAFGLCAAPSAAHAQSYPARTVTVVVPPGGRGDNGVPPGRTDLSDLEQLLRQPIEVEYLPYRC